MANCGCHDREFVAKGIHEHELKFIREGVRTESTDRLGAFILESNSASENAFSIDHTAGRSPITCSLCSSPAPKN
jgi:hypothetical protein